MTAQMAWTCRAKPLDQNGDLAPITVGEKFQLSCQGDSVALNKENLKIVAGTEVPNKFKLVLLDVQRLEATGGDLTVTSYVAGTQKAQGIVLTDGQNFVPLEGFQWDVQSVLKPPQDGKPPEPFGPLGPYRLSVPLWVWLLLALVLIAAAYITQRILRRRVQRKRLLRELESHRTARLPFDEFHHDLRKLDRKFSALEIPGQEFVGELNGVFRLYLVREFRVPALQWSTSEILSEMKRFHRPVFDQTGGELRRVLGELDKAMKLTEPLKPLDREQLVKLCRETSEKLWKNSKAEIRKSEIRP